ncbi:MAG: hypothetical protein Q4F57_02230 [Weeksellaceae bacterium]|nr:hypothetical protein [Weeksellaceae bacterium]
MRIAFTFALVFLILNCSSQQITSVLDPRNEKYCKKLYDNNFTEIAFDKFITVNGQDSLIITDVRYHCGNSSLYTHKAMYDRYGKWHRALYAQNREHPILVWQNVDLLSNGKRYTVLTAGLESMKHMYSSVMVLDENEQDILGQNTDERKMIVNHFGNLIRKNSEKNRSFYETYWPEVDPDRWEVI